MFEQGFDNMFADVWFDDRDKSEADEEGIGKYCSGFNTFHTMDALTAIASYDRALRGNHYKAKRNRLLAQRNCIAMAFGPEMIDRVGIAK